MAGENETAFLQELKALARSAAEARRLFHTDAVQAFGKVPPRRQRDEKRGLASLNRAQGVRRRAWARCTCGAAPRVCGLTAQMDGGGPRARFPLGHVHVPGIVGFGPAAELALEEMPGRCARPHFLRAKNCGAASWMRLIRRT
jgi:cysteine desulfurase